MVRQTLRMGGQDLAISNVRWQDEAPAARSTTGATWVTCWEQEVKHSFVLSIGVGVLVLAVWHLAVVDVLWARTGVLTALGVSLAANAALLTRLLTTRSVRGAPIAGRNRGRSS